MSFRNSNNEPNIDNIGEKVNCLQLGSDPLQPDTMNVLKEMSVIISISD